MVPTFNVRKTLSRSANAEPNDVLNLKAVMGGLGHYKMPKWGITPYPDQDLFSAVEAFQKQNRLKVDGVLKPGGPTERTLDKTLTKGFVAGEWDWMEKGVPLGTKGNKAKRRSTTDTLPSLLASYAPEDEVVDTPRPKPAEKDTRVAIGPGVLLAIPPLVAAGARIIAPHTSKLLREAQRLFGAAVTAKKLEEAAKAKRQKADAAERISITPPMPPTPGFEPPKEKDKLPQKEEYPADPPELPKKPGNVPLKIMPSIEVFPEPDEALRDIGLIIENSLGTPLTQEETNQIKKNLEKGLKERGVDVTHIGGGKTVKGEHLKERYLKPSGSDGAARPDGSFKIKNKGKAKPGDRFLDFNTIDTWKDGITPTARERRALEKIKRLKKAHGEIGDVLAFPKSRHYGKADWEKDMQEIIDIYLDAHYGKKKDK